MKHKSPTRKTSNRALRSVPSLADFEDGFEWVRRGNELVGRCPLCTLEVRLGHDASNPTTPIARELLALATDLARSARRIDAVGTSKRAELERGLEPLVAKLRGVLLGAEGLGGNAIDEGRVRFVMRWVERGHQRVARLLKQWHEGESDSFLKRRSGAPPLRVPGRALAVVRRRAHQRLQDEYAAFATAFRARFVTRSFRDQDAYAPFLRAAETWASKTRRAGGWSAQFKRLLTALDVRIPSDEALRVQRSAIRKV